MTPIEPPGSSTVAGEAASPPEPANDNWGVASDWRTPAETMQMIRRMKDEMRRELAADFTLRACPEHRKYWEILIEMEKCARWQLYGEREG